MRACRWRWTGVTQNLDQSTTAAALIDSQSLYMPLLSLVLPQPLTVFASPSTPQRPTFVTSGYRRHSGQWTGGLGCQIWHLRPLPPRNNLLKRMFAIFLLCFYCYLFYFIFYAINSAMETYLIVICAGYKSCIVLYLATKYFSLFLFFYCIITLLIWIEVEALTHTGSRLDQRTSSGSNRRFLVRNWRYDYVVVNF